MSERKYSNHYEMSVAVNANQNEVFSYADDHRNFSSHMNQSSWMMGGGSMQTEIDEGKGQRVGSHIKMGGKVMGVELALDEVITVHEPPKRKEWETVGDINLLVIDQYRLGFEISPHEANSDLRVYIDYDLPKSAKARLLGVMFGGMYAKWCVGQMANGVSNHFNKK